MAGEKIYFEGILIKERKFQGGSILKTSIKVDEFIRQLEEYAKKGWVNVDICERRQPGKNGQTHYMVLDTFVPDSNHKSRKGNNRDQELDGYDYSEDFR